VIFIGRKPFQRSGCDVASSSNEVRIQVSTPHTTTRRDGIKRT